MLLSCPILKLIFILNLLHDEWINTLYFQFFFSRMVRHTFIVINVKNVWNPTKSIVVFVKIVSYLTTDVDLRRLKVSFFLFFDGWGGSFINWKKNIIDNFYFIFSKFSLLYVIA